MRLYQDAVDRVARMEKLREKYSSVNVVSSDGQSAIGRKHAVKDAKRPTANSPIRTNVGGMRRDSVDVLSMVERSDLIEVLAPATPKASATAVFDLEMPTASSPRHPMLLRGQTLSMQNAGGEKSAALAMTSPDAARRRHGAASELAESVEHSPFLRGGSHVVSAYPDHHVQPRFSAQWQSTVARQPVPAVGPTPFPSTLGADGQGAPRLLQHSRMTTIPAPSHDGRLLQAPPVVTWVLEKPQHAHPPPLPPSTSACSRPDAPTQADPPQVRKQEIAEGDVNPVAAHMRKLCQSEPTLPVIDRGTQLGT
eukprot:1727746-Amphidinium_carterae.1